jgi:hypothetical protein
VLDRAAAAHIERTAQQQALFNIIDRLIKVVEAGRELDIAERACIAQLVGPLVLLQRGRRVEQEGRRGVDIAKRFAVIVPPAENMVVSQFEISAVRFL